MILRRAILVVLLLGLPLAAGDKSKGVPMAKIPDQKAEVVELTLATLAQSCNNYAWAVVVEAILKAQEVPLDQHFWVDKASGGELCIDPLPELERLTKVLDGGYTLTDGRKVKLATKVIAGAPSIPDDALAPLKHGVPILVFWNARAYVLEGAVYDEYIYPNGQRMYLIRELKMLDPLASAKKREVSFVNGTDDPAGIQALVIVTATTLLRTQWQTETKW